MDFFGKNPFNAGFGLSGSSLGQGPIEELQQQLARCFTDLKEYAKQIGLQNAIGNTESAKFYQDLYDKQSRKCRILQNRITELINAQRQVPGSTEQARGSFVQPRGSATAFPGPTPIPTSYYSQPSRSSYPISGSYGSVAYSSPASRSSLSPFAPALRGLGFWRELTTTPLSL